MPLQGSVPEYTDYVGFVLAHDDFLEDVMNTQAEAEIEFATEMTQRFLEQKETDEFD